jgi:2-polyprenyl-3-methyl-5-hydroxy-6-metoxy-1,4-benzoquinol methylase
MVRQLAERLADMEQAMILDVGCGEGKNAAFLSRSGSAVDAFDVSSAAISNARAAWPDEPIRFFEADIVSYDFPHAAYDAVVVTGPLHCLADEAQITKALYAIQAATKPGGYNVLSVFNDRSHDLSGHAVTFDPTLLPHSFYETAYGGWQIIECSDCDLKDEHPNTEIPHHHSITRIMAVRPQ